MNKVYDSKSFNELSKKLGVLEKLFIEKCKIQIKHNLRTGKPLRYYWIREKKLGNKRLIYIINVNLRKALLVFFVNKKDQQNSIDFIIYNKEYFFNELR